MTRWSIRNWVAPINYKQFKKLTVEFEQAVGRSCATDCRLEFTVMSKKPLVTTFMQDNWIMDGIDEINRQRTFLTTNSLTDITKAIWNRAAYIGVTILPAGDKAKPETLGKAEFKGGQPRLASFYLQPDNDKLKQAIIRRHRGKLIGTGYHSNSYTGAGPEEWSIST